MNSINKALFTRYLGVDLCFSEIPHIDLSWDEIHALMERGVVVLRDKVIQPLNATLSRPTGRLRMSTATPTDWHYHALRVGMSELFEDLGLPA